MLQEPDGLDTELGTLVMRKLPPHLFTDAYFAALACNAHLGLVTFDKDFERFDLAMLRLVANEH